MKPALGILILAALILALFFFFRPLAEKSGYQPAPTTVAVVRPPPSNPPSPAVISVAPSASVAAVASPASLTAEQRRTMIDAETEKLSTWAAQGTVPVPEVTAALGNPEKEIRLAAIDAAKQSGNAAFIPALKTALAAAADPEEQEALLDAEEFLSLPAVDLTARSPSTSAPAVPVKSHAERLAELRGQ